MSHLMQAENSRSSRVRQRDWSEDDEPAAQRQRVEPTQHFCLQPRRGQASFLGDLMRNLEDQCLELTKARVASLQLRSRLQLSTDALRDVAQSSGDRRLQNMRHLMANMGWQRSEDQLTFHRMFDQAVMPLFWGDEWDDHSVRVMEQEQLDTIQSEVMLLAPRRFGKTMSICSYCLGVLMCIPGIKVAVFSQNGRTSKAILQIIMAFMDVLGDDVNNRVCRLTKEELFISQTPLPPGCGPTSDAARRLSLAGDTSQLKCYPATVSGKSLCVLLVALGSSLWQLHLTPKAVSQRGQLVLNDRAARLAVASKSSPSSVAAAAKGTKSGKLCVS